MVYTIYKIGLHKSLIEMQIINITLNSVLIIIVGKYHTNNLLLKFKILFESYIFVCSFKAIISLFVLTLLGGITELSRPGFSIKT